MSEIIFYPKNKLVKEIVPPPQPVTIPGWFKDIPLYNDGSSKLNVENGTPNYSAKICVPFTDSFQTGYVFTTWTDIQVKKVNGETRFTWGSTEPDLAVVESRVAAKGIPFLKGFEPYTFAWTSQWGIQTPKGYSCLFTHPLNRHDLPFYTTSGVMDTDKWGIWGNQPFAIQDDWEGVIEAGTPLIQAIPFKRENWTSKIDETLGEWGIYQNIRRGGKFRGYYKHNSWERKSFK